MIVAILRDGTEVALASRYGSSLERFHEALRETALTGSAVALSDTLLETAAGERIPYSSVNTFEATQRF